MVDESIYTSGEYLENNPGWHREKSLWKAKRLLNGIPFEKIEEFKTGSGIRILDFGCGAGLILDYVCKFLSDAEIRIIKSVGIDFSPQAIEMAESLDGNHDFKIGSVDDIQERYDIIILADVIEHLEDPVSMIKQLSARCDYMLFHIPLEESIINKLPGRKARIKNRFGHKHFFTKDSALKLLDECGLLPICPEYTKRFLSPRIRRTISQKILFYPRLLLSNISMYLLSKTLDDVGLVVFTSTNK